MFFARCWIAGSVLLLSAGAPAFSQAVESATQAPASSTNAGDDVARVPGLSNVLQGFNAGISVFGVHNSAIGWYSVATPAVSYAFTPHYSADVSASLYMHLMVENTAPGAPPDQRLKLDRFDAGDTFAGFHAAYALENFRDTVSAYVTLPSGDASKGLGTGRVTFDVTNHAERTVKRVGFLLDVGAGDSSTLSNYIVTKSYSSLGAIAHFQAGSVLWLKGNYFEALAYEQLPMGSQKVYSSVPPPDGGGQAPPPNITTSSEDNGLTAVVGIPLTSNLSALAYYNRSLRRSTDTVSFGLTYVLRGSQRGKWLSMIDRALREAEKDSDKRP